MSNFLRMLPRRLPVALADYVAVTGEEESRRRAIAGRIYAALPTEQQAEISRICEPMSANARNIMSAIARQITSVPGGRRVAALDGF